MVLPTAEQLIENFNSTLPEQERVLESAAQNVKLGLERDSEIFRSFTQLQFFVLTVDFDMRVMLRALLVDPQNRLTAEKFFALTLEEADESVGGMINGFNKAMRLSSKDSGRDLFDIERFTEEERKFKQAMKEMRDDKEFNQILRLIRNTVSGHIVGDKVGIQNSAIWVLTRKDVPRNVEGVMSSHVVRYAVSTLGALDEFAHGLQRCLQQERTNDNSHQSTAPPAV